MKKEDEFKSLSVDCKDGKNRTVVFKRSVEPIDGLPEDFCERNCKYYKCCTEVKSPTDDSMNLQRWCSEQDIDGLFHPADLDEKYPELFKDAWDKIYEDGERVATFSEIHEKICPLVCMDFDPAERSCSKCTPENKMCFFKELFLSKPDGTTPRDQKILEAKNSKKDQEVEGTTAG